MIKKGEFAIYAIALMLVGAGYFNYTTFQNEVTETYSEDVEQIENKNANVGDAVLVSSKEIQEEEKENNDQEDEDKQESNEENASTSDDYYAKSKLERDTMYAEMLSNYEKIINNTNCSEAQKSIATQEISKINNAKNAIMICENLILTKGFENCVILINDSSINVVVSIEGGLKKEDVAKIQNIVSREIDTEIEKIHISECN